MPKKEIVISKEGDLTLTYDIEDGWLYLFDDRSYEPGLANFYPDDVSKMIEALQKIQQEIEVKNVIME